MRRCSMGPKTLKPHRRRRQQTVIALWVVILRTVLAAGCADVLGSGLHPAMQSAAGGRARRVHQPCSGQPGRAARGRRHRQRLAAAAGANPAQVPAPKGGLLDPSLAQTC